MGEEAHERRQTVPRPVILDQHWDQAFQNSPFWLRFELGGEVLGNRDQPVPRFLQAFHRAKTLCDALFAQSDSVIAILAAARCSADDLFAPAENAMAVLEAMGFRPPPPSGQWTAPLIPNDDDAPVLDWHAMDLADHVSRDTLVWNAIVYEMPLTPKAPVLSWLVDFYRGVMAHIYDDRGMDIHALDRESIAPLYRQFATWLLDFDRPRMRAAFERDSSQVTDSLT